MSVLSGTRPATQIAAAGYVLVVTGLASAAQVTGNGRYYLAALLLTLPAGLPAIVGVHLAYGLVEQVNAMLLPRADGDQLARQTLALPAPVNVLLFAAAAVADVLLVHQLLLLLAARRAGLRRPPSGPV